MLQAFANLAAKRLQKRRAPLQFKVVFSNILEKHGSIFFFRRWQDTYGAFQGRIKKHNQGGMRWHPYEKKTAAQSRHLKTQERNQFVGRLRTAYADLMTLMP